MEVLKGFKREIEGRRIKEVEESRRQRNQGQKENESTRNKRIGMHLETKPNVD